MSQENVELVRTAIEHFIATGDPQWSVTHEEVEVFDHDILDAGDYRGHAGFRHWLEDWAAAWSDFSMEPDEFLDAGDRVVAVVRMTATGRGSGVVVQRQDAIVCKVHDGKIVRVDYYNNRQQALEDLGLAE